MIGDSRLGSMETGTAIVRAMIKVMELKETNPVHVINMSYGEHAHWSNTGYEYFSKKNFYRCKPQCFLIQIWFH